MMDAKTIARMQEEASLNAALRSGKGKGTRLLDDVDQNIGNASNFLPQSTVGGQYTTIPQTLTNNSRLLSLTSESKLGQSITVVMTAARLVNTSGWVGPLTGILEFGNGAVITKTEFDIPFGPYQGSFLTSTNSVEPQDSGAVIQVPTGVLRAYVRYDNAFITPTLAGYAFGGIGSPAPLPPISGPFAPNTKQPAPIRAKAFADYFGRIHSKLYKTQYIYVGKAANPVTFTPSYYNIPPFAKSVRVVRVPQTAGMQVILYDQLPATNDSNIFGDIYQIPSTAFPGTISPTIRIDGNTSVIRIESLTADPVDQVCAVKLVYEIGF